MNLRGLAAKRYQIEHNVPYPVALRAVDKGGKPPATSYWIPVKVPQADNAASGTVLPRSLIAPLALNRSWRRSAQLMDDGVGKSLLVTGVIGSGKSTIAARVVESLFDWNNPSQMRMWVVDDIVGPSHPVSKFHAHPLTNDSHVEKVFHQEAPPRLLREVANMLRARQDFLDAAEAQDYRAYLDSLETKDFAVKGHKTVKMPPLVVMFDHVEDSRTHRVVRYLCERGPSLGVGVVLVTHSPPSGFRFDDTMTMWDEHATTPAVMFD